MNLLDMEEAIRQKAAMQEWANRRGGALSILPVYDQAEVQFVGMKPPAGWLLVYTEDPAGMGLGFGLSEQPGPGEVSVASTLQPEEEEPKSFAQPVRVGGMNVFINPGSGPVGGATLENATENMMTFVADIVAMGVSGQIEIERDEAADKNGRFGFEVHSVVDGVERRVDIEMPGLPLAEVRYQDGLNAWDFPRLYENGSSWLWTYAVEMAKRDLFDPVEPEEEEEEEDGTD